MTGEVDTAVDRLVPRYKRNTNGAGRPDDLHRPVQDDGGLIATAMALASKPTASITELTVGAPIDANAGDAPSRRRPAPFASAPAPAPPIPSTRATPAPVLRIGPSAVLHMAVDGRGITHRAGGVLANSACLLCLGHISRAVPPGRSHSLIDAMVPVRPLPSTGIRGSSISAG